MTRATQADLPEVIDFLKRDICRSMFALSNLDRFGLDGAGKYGTSCWVRRSGGEITDVLSITNNGIVMPQCPTDPIIAPVFGRKVAGFVGPAEQCRPLMDLLQIDGQTNVDRDEPQFELARADLIMPDAGGDLIPFRDAPRDLMIQWLTQYSQEAIGMTAQDAANSAAHAVDDIAADPQQWVLVVDGVPVAKTGFNADFDGVAQVGGVFTPPEHRGRGYARRAVAMHLAQAAEFSRFTLFAASDTAARVYKSIGFKRIGDWTLCLYRSPIDV